MNGQRDLRKPSKPGHGRESAGSETRFSWMRTCAEAARKGSCRRLVRRVWLTLMVTGLAFGLTVTWPGRAEVHAGRVLTLGECLALTLDYSRDVLKARENEALSQGRYIEERAAALPQVKLESHVLRGHDATLTEFGLPLDKTEGAGNVNFTQTVFTWGQVSSAIRAARHDQSASAFLSAEARQLALREAATSFYNLLLALELQDVAQDNVRQKERHLEEAQRKFQAGVAMEYDVLAASVGLANARPELTRAENDIRLARDRLRYFLGIEDEFQIQGELEAVLQPPAPLPEVLERARAQRAEVAYYQQRLGVFRELVTVAKGGNKPRVDFRGNAGYVNSTSTDVNLSGERWDAGLFLAFPVFDGFRTRGQVDQARSRLRTVDIEYKKLLDEIALDARGSTSRVIEAVQIVRALDTTVAQAQRLLEMAEAGYRYDVKTRLDVDDAEFNLLSARSNLAKARRDYLVAHTRLLWVMGEDLQSVLNGAGATAHTGG
jgi:outer membrane protein TolC